MGDVTEVTLKYTWDGRALHLSTLGINILIVNKNYNFYRTLPLSLRDGLLGKHESTLPEDPSWFPAPVLGYPQPHITPAPRDLIPSSVHINQQ